MVKWYFVDDESIKSAAFRAAKAIMSPSIFELIEKNICMNYEEKKKASKEFSTQVGNAFLIGKNTRI